MAMTVITTRSSMRVKPCSRLGHTQHLLGRRDPGLHFPPPVLPERRHTLRLRDLAEGAGLRTLQERPLDVVRGDEELKQARATAVSRATAGRAPPPALEHDVPH